VCPQDSGATFKVRTDPYFGDDPALTADHGLPFYRGTSSTIALESVSNVATQSPGWAVASEAQTLWYYRVALAAPEDDVRALLADTDDVLFSELDVRGDELLTIPMRPLREWFSEHADAYAPRPVTFGDTATWCRIVPLDDVLAAVEGCGREQGVFASLATGR